MPSPALVHPRQFRPLVAVAFAAVATAAGPATADCARGTAGDELVAARAGLVREWIVQIPFDSSASRLERVVVGDGLVVAQSGDGGVHAVQASAAAGESRPGSVLWSQRLGRPGGPALAAGIGPGLVTVAHDLDLHALDRRTGHVAWHEPLGTLPHAPAVPVGDWVYVGMGSGGMLRLPARPRSTTGASEPEPAPPPRRGKAAEPAQDDAPADDEPPARRRPAKQPAAKREVSEESRQPIALDSGGPVEWPPQPFAEGVVWCTKAGRIVAIEPSANGWNRFQEELPAAPAGPPVVRGTSLFATTGGDRGAATAEFVRIDLVRERNERLATVWRTPLPGRPVGGPLLAGGLVVASLGPDGIAACAADTGAPAWRSHVVGTIVAATGRLVWCLDDMGGLTALDLATGLPRFSLCLGGFTVPVVNTATDRLVLASPRGLVVSLAPAVPEPPPAPPPAQQAKPARKTERSDATAPAAAARGRADPAARPRP
jgi:outer membrane protein assembly factor BamB